ncbi:class I mannose-6-phosphate isomerase [Vibrio taketomensis]|uniref:class I mannose-6-phosphate isomerase n=1 Tax=Vibrio taketomensis TaxID=2572923 RepID=UPI001389CBE5|nr:class I mannose-6-phosphate isomerase [Vibrio taketomensis]
MKNYQEDIICFKRNRVWRTYQGGMLLDKINNHPSPQDSHFPEEWIASTVKAVNSGREDISEGISITNIDGSDVEFTKLIESNPSYFLGSEHTARYGNNPMLLVKYLDSSVRLHFQVHPTVEFSRQYLNSNSGKAEAYYFIDFRESIEEPYIYLGFQNPPSKEELKKMIETQDIDAMEHCFEKISISRGDCFYIPGGMPHAIGENILMVEIMEPSDWAVRFEFEKSGYTLPEEARFMKRDLDFCLDVFNMDTMSKQEVLNTLKQQPKQRFNYDSISYKEVLIDQSVTSCFQVSKSTIKGNICKSEPSFYIGIIVQGECTVRCGNHVHHLKQFDKFFCPAGLDSLNIESTDGVELLECYPPH